MPSSIAPLFLPLLKTIMRNVDLKQFNIAQQRIPTKDDSFDYRVKWFYDRGFTCTAIAHQLFTTHTLCYDPCIKNLEEHKELEASAAFRKLKHKVAAVIASIECPT